MPLHIFSTTYVFSFFCDETACFPLHMSCVIVPIGQYTHHERGLKRIIVTSPKTVDVSITLYNPNANCATHGENSVP